MLKSRQPEWYLKNQCMFAGNYWLRMRKQERNIVSCLEEECTRQLLYHQRDICHWDVTGSDSLILSLPWHSQIPDLLLLYAQSNKKSESFHNNKKCQQVYVESKLTKQRFSGPQCHSSTSALFISGIVFSKTPQLKNSEPPKSLHLYVIL